MHAKCLEEHDPKSIFPLKCVSRYADGYDNRWRRADTLREDIVALKEKFGTAVDAGIEEYRIQVMVSKVDSVGNEALNYENWKITHGQKIIPRHVLILVDSNGICMHRLTWSIPRHVVRSLFDEQLNGTKREPRSGGTFQLTDNQLAHAAQLDC